MTKTGVATVVNTKTIAKMFGLHERRIRQLAEEGVIDRVGHGRFDLIETVNKYISFLRLSNDQLEENDVTDSLEFEKYLHEKAKREKAEIELAHIKGRMHSSTEVEKVMNNMLASFRARILAIPSKTAPSLIARDEISQIEQIVEVQIHEALSELANYDPKLFMDAGDEEEEDEQEST